MCGHVRKRQHQGKEDERTHIRTSNTRNSFEGIADRPRNSLDGGDVKLNDRTRRPVGTLNQFVIELRSASARQRRISMCFGAKPVETIHRPTNRTRHCSSNRRQRFEQLSLLTLRAANLLSMMSLLLGLAAAFIPGSLEQRIGSFLFFGLIPAAALHLGGAVLGPLLAFSSELCEVTIALCFRSLARIVKKYVKLASQCVSYASARYLMPPARTVVSSMSNLSRSTSYSIRRSCQHADRAIFEFSCLLIRSGARFILRMQRSRTTSRR
jgi:hypothetical protein